MPMSTQLYDRIGRPDAKSPGSQTPGDSGTPGSPRRRRSLHHRGLEKLALNSGTTGGARKMTQKCVKNCPSASISSSNSSMTEAEAPPLFSTRKRHQGPQELHLRQLHCFLYCLGHLHPVVAHRASKTCPGTAPMESSRSC